MKKIIKKLFAPIALLSLALGVGISLNHQKDVIGASAATTVSVGNDFNAVSGNFDANFRYDSFKGGGTTAPALNSGDIRLYQKNGGGDGGYITVSPRTADYKITSLTISNNNESAGKGPFTAHYILNGAINTPDPTGWTQIGSGNLNWTGTSYTHSNPSGFTHFKLIATGTDKNNRVYVDSISITYDYFGGATVPVSGISIDDNIESLSLMEGTSQQLTATIAPSDATNKNVSWSSSDETKVTVVNGLVNALAVTSTPVTITVTTDDGNWTDTVEVTVTADPFTLIKTSTFGSSGSPDYPTVTSMGAYFGSGYGTADKGKVAKVKSTNALLANVPVGSDIKVEIAAVVNHASDTKTATVYGLDYAGDRISKMSGTYTVPASGGISGIDNMTTFAQENKGLVVLNGLLTKKAYGIEVEFSTSAARALLVEISVYYSSDETDENQAIAFANLVNNDVGLGANGSCSAILEVLQNDYSLLSSGAKTIFDTSSDNDFVSARERLSYLESWVAQNPSATPTREAVNNSSNRNLAVVSIGLIGLTSILGYYFINKKRSLG